MLAAGRLGSRRPHRPSRVWARAEWPGATRAGGADEVQARAARADDRIRSEEELAAGPGGGRGQEEERGVAGPAEDRDRADRPSCGPKSESVEALRLVFELTRILRLC